MSRTGFVAGLLLSASIVSGLTGAAMAKDYVRFKGSLDGSFTVTPIDPNDPLKVAVHLQAAGQGSHIGSFTYDFPHLVDRTTVPSTGIGLCTITAANGDQIFAAIEGTATLIVPGLLDGTEIAVITGGTGRFEGASGGFTVRRLIDQRSLTSVGWFEGTISPPGKIRP